MTTSTRARRIVSVTAALGAAVLIAVGAVAPTGAATGPDDYESAQVGLTYTVYEPTTTARLAQTGFELNGCMAGMDEQINADYGSQATSTSRWIGLNQSQMACQDGPDGVGPAATFMVRGAKATVLGDCAGNASTCPRATRAGVRRSGFTTVTLPSGGTGLSATHVEVYSQGLTLAQIKAFVRGLKPVG